MWAVWWVWVVAGFALGVVEVLMPGFIFLGFAIGAVITGLLVGIGVLGGNTKRVVVSKVTGMRNSFDSERGKRGAEDPFFG